MRVSLSQRLNQPINNYNKNIQNPAFKADPLTMKLMLGLHTGVQRADQVINVKKEIFRALNNPANNDSVRKALLQLSVLNSKKDSTFAFKFFKMFSWFNTIPNMPKIKDMKQMALEKLFPALDDNNGFNRSVKTALLTSMYGSGEYLSDNYLKTFENLPDDHYYAFKQELAEKVLYSGNASDKPEKYLYSFSLIQALDKPEYAAFLNKNIDGINNLNANIEVEATKKLTETSNKAFYYYNSNFDKYADDKLWQLHLSRAFYNKIQKANFDPSKVAVELNIKNEQAEDIIKDLKALYKAEKTSDKEQALEIYKSRLLEKFNSPLELYMENYQQRKYFPEEAFAYFNAATEKNANIAAFSQKTGIDEKLKEIFSDDFNNLKKLIDDCQRRYRRESENGEREEALDRWAHEV